MKSKNQQGKYVFIGLIAISLLAFALYNVANYDPEKIALEKARKIEIEDSIRQSNHIAMLDSLKNKIKDDIDFVSSSFKSSEFRGSTDALVLELLLFSALKKRVDTAIYYSNDLPELTSLANKLEINLTKTQKREFPILRKEFTSIIDNKLWEDDIDVIFKGNQNKTIRFIGGTFAANRNIKSFHSDIVEILKLYRFTRAEYLWNKIAEEYTYYTIESPSDIDPVVFSD